jgi:hypothetical protein
MCPAALWWDRRREDDSALRDLGAVVVRPDPCLADVAAPLVTEHEYVVLDATERLAGLLDRRVLDLEQIREVGADRDRDLGLDGLRPVVQDAELFEEPVADDAPPDD